MAVAAPTNAALDNTPKLPPNQSLYIQNLPERLQKEDLRRELYVLFSTYGPVLDVTALKSKKMRGQAHVLFRDVHSATQAMRSCRGMEFFGREMFISYSRNRSNTLAKLTGTFNQPPPTSTTTTQSQQTSHIAQPPSGFPAPPGTLPAPPSGLPPPPGTLPGPLAGLPPPPTVNGEAPPPGGKATAKEVDEVASPQGVKRQREESDDEGEAPMDEDEDEDEEGGEMEMSDED